MAKPKKATLPQKDTLSQGEIIEKTRRPEKKIVERGEAIKALQELKNQIDLLGVESLQTDLADLELLTAKQKHKTFGSSPEGRMFNKRFKKLLEAVADLKTSAKQVADEQENILDISDEKKEVKYDAEPKVVMIDESETRLMKDIPEAEKIIEYSGKYGVVSGRCDYGGEGSKYKNKNEDTMFVATAKDGSLIAVVVDGAGGSGDGLLASIEGNKKLTTELVAGKDIKTAMSEAGARIDQARKERGINESIYACAAVAEVKPDGKVFLNASGDSKAMTIRHGDKLDVGTTKMQNYAADLVGAGAIEPQDYYTNPYNNVVLGVLGKDTDRSLQETISFDGKNGDQIILASDGVWDVVSEWEILDLSEKFTGAELQKAIFDLAYQRNNSTEPYKLQFNGDVAVNMPPKVGITPEGKIKLGGDNITVQVVELRNMPEAPAAQPNIVFEYKPSVRPEIGPIDHEFKTGLAEEGTTESLVNELLEEQQAEGLAEIPKKSIEEQNKLKAKKERAEKIEAERAELANKLSEAKKELAIAFKEKEQTSGFFKKLFNSEKAKIAENNFRVALGKVNELEKQSREKAEKDGDKLLESLNNTLGDTKSKLTEVYKTKESKLDLAWRRMGEWSLGSLIEKIGVDKNEESFWGKCKKILDSSKTGQKVAKAINVRSGISLGLTGLGLLGVPGMAESASYTYAAARGGMAGLGAGMGTRAAADGVYNWYSKWFGRRGEVFANAQEEEMVWEKRIAESGAVGKKYLELMKKVQKKKYLSDSPEERLKELGEVISGFEAFAFVNNIPLDQLMKRDENYKKVLGLQNEAVQDLLSNISQQYYDQASVMTIDQLKEGVTQRYLVGEADRQSVYLESLMKNIKKEKQAKMIKRLASVAVGMTGGAVAAFNALQQAHAAAQELLGQRPPSVQPIPRPNVKIETNIVPGAHEQGVGVQVETPTETPTETPIEKPVRPAVAKPRPRVPRVRPIPRPISGEVIKTDSGLDFTLPKIGAGESAGGADAAKKIEEVIKSSKGMIPTDLAGKNR